MKRMNNPLRWSSELICSLSAHGVTHAVISPGSRSTPLTLAAAIHPSVKKNVILDERSAAFIALGIGKATGIPAILICTSGTAAANYFPAVIEAKESGVPMIILSADRPPNLRSTGSSQTIDQIKLFGDHTVFFHEAGEPVMSDTDLKRISYLGKQAVDMAIRKGGTAHINLPFRKPLEPAQQQLADETERIRKNAGQVRIKPDHTAKTIHPGNDISEMISSSKKPLLIAGPANPRQALISHLQNFSSRLNAPVISEPGSGLSENEYTIHRFEQFLRNKNQRKKLSPDLIIRFGDQPFTKSLLMALEDWADIPAIHISSRDAWQDHSMSADVFIHTSPEDRLNPDFFPARSDPEWIGSWKAADQLAQEKLALLLKSKPLTDGHVFKKLSDQITDHWNVMLSNSFPVRDMALFGKSTRGQFVNRGAAGIDGITSTALGLHLSGDKPTCCITGDLAFLHDANALYSLQDSGAPFVIVVINNGGGTIFRMLPVYHENISSDLHQTYFETPQYTDIRYLARASGVKYRKIETPAQLDNLHLDSFSEPTIIECRTDAGESMKLRQRLWSC
jgi:2-succinyl-5-enolpyruvyl-6-hydroxy-3-cyclohexene-1-carboxylate synthase